MLVLDGFRETQRVPETTSTRTKFSHQNVLSAKSEEFQSSRVPRNDCIFNSTDAGRMQETPGPEIKGFITKNNIAPKNIGFSSPRI